MLFNSEKQTRNRHNIHIHIDLLFIYNVDKRKINEIGKQLSSSVF